MNVEFLVNQELNDGRQLFITEKEFKKAAKNEDEFNSFAFATECFFAYYGLDTFINAREYETIRQELTAGGAVIITVVEEKYPRNCFPEVYVSNHNRLKSVEI